MPRASTGGVVGKTTSRGTSYALRFRALGQRQYIHLGHQADGWTRQRAEQELANVLADVRRGIWQPPVPTPAAEAREIPTFHVFASEWFEAQKLDAGRGGTGLSAAGAADLEWRLSCHLLPAFAAKRLDEITVEDVDRFRRGKVRDGALAASSINKLLATLAAVLEVAVEYEHIGRNPAKGRRRRLPAARPERTALEQAGQIEALLAAASTLDAAARTRRGQRRALLATLVFAGLRIGEALALRWADVDLARGTITVRAAKTAAGVRTVYVLPVLRDELVAYRAALGTVGAGELVFRTTKGKPIGMSNVRRRILAEAIRLANEAIAARADRAPIPAGLTPHGLRRTFASLLFAVGEAPPYVMAQMGHETAALTLAIYARQMDRRDGEPERLRALVEGRDWAPTGTSASRQASAKAFPHAA